MTRHYNGPQLPLFGRPVQATPARARRTDPATSHEAAAAIKVSPLWADILAAFSEAGIRGLNSHELSLVTGRDRVCVSPALRPMERVGLLVETKERRPGPTGAPGIVWKLAKWGIR